MGVTPQIQQIVLVSSRSESVWPSCQKLTDSLRRLYRSLPLKVTEVFVEDLPTEDSLDPQLVAIIDQRINFPGLLKAKFSWKGKGIIWNWHIFGDFVQRVHFNYPQGEELKPERINIICGSFALRDVVKKLVLDPERVTALPFPVEIRSPAPVGAIKNQSFLYAGRITFSKNVLALIHLFKTYRSSDEVLEICGQVDPRFEVFSSTAQIENYTPATFHDLIARDPQIRFHGHLEGSALDQFFSSSRCLINLSTFELEDFGLVAREALSFGLPVILSDWGGHRDLRGLKGVWLIPVTFENEHFHIDEKSFQHALNEVRKSTIGPEEIQEDYQQKFGQIASTSVLLQTLNSSQEVFKGWSEECVRYMKRNIALSDKAPYLNRHTKLYEPYYLTV